MLRVRTLSGYPVMVERTTRPDRIAALAVGADPDTVSFTVRLEEQRVPFADAQHTIDLAAADETDADLLGCAVDDLLREQRRSTDPAGTPIELLRIPGPRRVRAPELSRHPGATPATRRTTSPGAAPGAPVGVASSGRDAGAVTTSARRPAPGSDPASAPSRSSRCSPRS